MGTRYPVSCSSLGLLARFESGPADLQPSQKVWAAVTHPFPRPCCKRPCISEAATAAWHEKIPVLELVTRKCPMEAERSNAIRTQLEDLTTRVVELRRYL